MKLSNKVYDILKWIAMYLLPAAGTLYFALAGIWGFPYGEQIVGTITAVDKTGIHVACGEDVLVLREVQLEGKKRMETDAFLRGYQVTEGTMLTDHKE